MYLVVVVVFCFLALFPERCFSGLNYCFGRFVWLRALGCWCSSYVRVPRLHFGCCNFGGFCAFLLLRVLACVTSLRNLHCNLLCMQVPVCSLGTSAQSCCTSAWSTFAVEKEGLSSCQRTKKKEKVAWWRLRLACFWRLVDRAASALRETKSLPQWWAVKAGGTLLE